LFPFVVQASFELFIFTFMKKNNIAILILAAGSSSRLGEPKQLLELNGETLLQKAIGTALGISDSVTVVLGANKEIIQPTISDYSIQLAFNKNWKEGMSSSIQVGMESLEHDKYDAVLIMLCDQPFVDVLLLNNIIAVFEKNKNPIVACEYTPCPLKGEDKIGVPALFDVSFFEKLKKLKGQGGAKALMMNHIEEVEKVVFEKGEIDVDTQEDWARLKNEI